LGYTTLPARETTNALTRSRDADLVASDDDDFLSRQQLLGHDAAQATEQVVATIDNLRGRQHHDLIRKAATTDTLLVGRGFAGSAVGVKRLP
jgi:hypothetical protein